MQKKIIFVNIWIGQFRWWGENFDLNMANEFYKKWYDIEFYYLCPLLWKDKFTFPKEYSLYPIRSPWLYPITWFFHKIPILKNIWIIRWIPRMLGQLFFEWQTYRHIRKRLANNDLLLVNFEFLQTCGLPMLSNLIYNKLWLKAITWWPWAIGNFIDSYFSKKNWKMIANWDAIKKIRNSWFNNVYNINLWVHDLFFEWNSIQKNDMRNNLWLDINKKYLIFVWRLIPIKNLFFLINLLPDLIKDDSLIHLIIIWEWFLESKLKEYINDLKLNNNISFMWFMNHEWLKKYYKASDICILTSSYDNFPCVITEAMATWLPVIASKVWWIPDIVKNDYNWYCLNLDKNLFVEKVLYLLSNKEKMDIFSKNAINTVEDNYSWKIESDKYLKLM